MNFIFFFSLSLTDLDSNYSWSSWLCRQSDVKSGSEHSFSGKTRSLFAGEWGGIELFFRMRSCSGLPVSVCSKHNTKITLQITPCIWNGIPILLTRKDFRQMFHTSFGFSSPGWGWSCIRAVFFYQLLSKLLLNPDFLSLLAQNLLSLLSPIGSIPAILLFYFWIFLLSCQSCLGSGMSQVHHCLLVPSLRA